MMNRNSVFVIFVTIILIGLSAILYATKNDRNRNIYILLFNVIFSAMISPFILAYELALCLILYIDKKRTLFFDGKIDKEIRYVSIMLILLLSLTFKQSGYYYKQEIFGDYTTFITCLLLLKSLSVIFDEQFIVANKKPSLCELFIYVSYFPFLLFGPIIKYKDFLSIHNENNKPNKVSIFSGMQYFYLGVFKKFVVANRLFVSISAVFAGKTYLSIIYIPILTIEIVLFLYFEFSGYYDMALGSSRMIGYKFKDNYGVPFISTNPIKFWNGWNISFASWIKEYIVGSYINEKNNKLKVMESVLCVVTLLYVTTGMKDAYIMWILYQLVLVVGYITLRKNNEFCKMFYKIPTLVKVVINNVLIIAPTVLLFAGELNISMLIGKNGALSLGLIVILALSMVMGTNIYGHLCVNDQYPIKHLDLGNTKNKVVFLFFIVICLFFAK